MSARRVLTATAVVVSVATTAGVAGAGTIDGEAQTPAATAVPTTVAGSPLFDAVEFFTDFFTGINGDPPRRGDLSQRVVAGSPADAFVTYLFGFGAARLGSRQGALEPFTVSRRTSALEGDEVVEVCTEGFCDTFSDFVVTDGRLESFHLNGVDIEGRLAAPSKAVEHGPVRVRVVGGFERVTVDELAVVLAIDAADEPLAVQWEEVVYVGPDWSTIKVDLLASSYPPEVSPDGEQEVVLQFPTASVGGDVVLTYSTESQSDPTGLRVPVEALDDVSGRDGRAAGVTATP